MAEDGFVDVTGYDLNQDTASHVAHGLPMDPHPKVAPIEDRFSGSWLMAPHTTDLIVSPMMQLQPQGLLPTAEDILQHHLAEPASMESVMASTPEPSWGHLPAAVYLDNGHSWDHEFLRPMASEDNMQALWAAQMQQSQGLQGQTIIPSDALVHADAGYGVASPSPLAHVESFDNTRLLLPQSPSFIDAEDQAGPSARPIYVSARSRTGGKTVVERERRPIGLMNGSKIQRRRKRYQKRIDNPPDNTEIKPDSDALRIHEEGVKIQWGKEGQIIFFQNTRACRWCDRQFKRPEHRKRHEETHDPEKRGQYGCTLCIRRFGRNDNYIEHYTTHMTRQGKDRSRNLRWPLRQLERMIDDPKIIAKLRQRYIKENGSLENAYLDNVDDEEVEEEEEQIDAA